MDHYELSDQLDRFSRMVEERGRFRDVLCAKCQHGVVYRRRGRLEPVAYCQQMRQEMPTDLAECSAFEAAGKLDSYELAKIALIVDPRVGVNDGSYA